MRQLRGKRDHVIVLLRGTAHGLTEAERHEVRFQLLKHTLGAALCRHKDHARTVKQGRQGKIQTGELTARHRMAADVVHTGVERRLLQMIDHKLLDADHIHDHAALFIFDMFSSSQSTVACGYRPMITRSASLYSASVAIASIEPSASACSAVARVRFQPKTRLSVRA